MFKKVLEILRKEVSGQSAFNFCEEISRYHRIQASPFIRVAVHRAVELLNYHGLNTEVLSYPADGSYIWSNHLFKEWNCHDAELRLTEPKDEAQPLALWSETKLSLLERSHPTPKGGVEAEVVVLDNGEEVSDYNDLDIEGKIVIANGNVMRVYELAVEHYGAIGIIYDGMSPKPPVRKEGDLDDALNRGQSGGWTGDEKPCFGFVLSPRKGRWLRKLVEKQRKKGKPVKVWANVDCKFYKGTNETAVATISGETSEEVIIVAHICHPQGYANDNASGNGAAMEAVRALQRLITKGELPKPKRTIKLTLQPEHGGSFAFLHENEARLQEIIAAINLDSVGNNQALCGSPLKLIKTPEAMPSFVNVLTEAIINEVKYQTGRTGRMLSPLFNYNVSQFRGGSDHFVYSDPTIGVPCILLGHGPDKFYHTSWDTLDKVDKEELRRVALIAATYAYFIANADMEETMWLASEVASRIKIGFGEVAQKIVTEAFNEVNDIDKPTKLAEAQAKLKEKIEYDLERGIETIKSVRRLIGDNPLFASIENRLVSMVASNAQVEIKAAEQTIADYVTARGLAPLPKIHKRKLRKIEKEAANIIPSRKYRGPISTRSYTHRHWLGRLSADDKDSLWRLEKEHKDTLRKTREQLVLYWADGERNLLDISKLIELETGRSDLEYLYEYLNLLRNLDLVEFV